MRTTVLLGLALGLVSSLPAAQARLYVASPSGALYSTDPEGGAFEVEIQVGETIHALARIGNLIYLGSPSGTIRSWNSETGTLATVATVSNDVTDLVVHRADLLASGSDGTVLRIDRTTGAVKETMTSSFDVQALAVDGDMLYAGTPFGVFQKLDMAAAAEDFTFAGLCGGPINSMSITEFDLYLGDSSGQVYVYSKSTEFVTYAYPVDNDADAIQRDGTEFLIGGGNGTIHRVTQIVGSVLATMVAPEPVEDLLLDTPSTHFAQDVPSISLASGGTATFGLFAPTALAGDAYIMLGSASGTTPGIRALGVHLALNPDEYFELTLPPYGDQPLFGSFGTFDADGAASASFALPSGITPALAGTVLHHAFVTFDSKSPVGMLSASTPSALTLTL